MNDVFISYNFEIKEQVKKLTTNLIQFNLKIWFDEKITNNDTLTKKSLDEIANSKLVLCCLTHQYCKSDECKKELSYSNELHKPIIILMIQNSEILQEFKIKENLTELTEISCYDSNSWLDDYKKIKDQIFKNLEVNALY
jgi:hypothetical protein